MIHHQVTQGSTSWLALRAGKPTASAFDRILTPAKMARSSQRDGYMCQLIAERIMQRPIEEHVSWWQQRGHEMEARAVAFYEGVRNLDSIPCGFCTSDDGRIGASPDRFVGDDGLLEVKAPKESTHVGYLLAGAMPDDYKLQVQGQMWVTGRQWADFLSWHPELPPSLVRVERDEKVIASIADAVTNFANVLDQVCKEMQEKGQWR